MRLGFPSTRSLLWDHRSIGQHSWLELQQDGFDFIGLSIELMIVDSCCKSLGRCFEVGVD